MRHVFHSERISWLDLLFLHVQVFLEFLNTSVYGDTLYRILINIETSIGIIDSHFISVLGR